MELIYDIQMTSLAIVVLGVLYKYFDAASFLGARIGFFTALALGAAIVAGFSATMFFIWLT